MVTSAEVTVRVPVQLSSAITAAVLATGTAEAQLTVTSAGINVITGAVWSSTVINWVELLELPHTSVAVQIRVTVNLFAQLPEVVTSLTVTVTKPAQLSVAVTELVNAAGTAEAQLTVMFAGVPEITGAVWSSTVIICVLVLVLPHTSLTL